MQTDEKDPEQPKKPETTQSAAQVEHSPKKAASKAKKSIKKVKAGKNVKKAPVKKAEEKQDTEIPMDAAAIKAYSSVIADAAEDSEPSQPVVYTKTIQEEPKQQAAPESLDFDPMGSMIQNEIASIKDASIKAAKDKEE